MVVEKIKWKKQSKSHKAVRVDGIQEERHLQTKGSPVAHLSERFLLYSDTLLEILPKAVWKFIIGQTFEIIVYLICTSHL